MNELRMNQVESAYRATPSISVTQSQSTAVKQGSDSGKELPKERVDHAAISNEKVKEAVSRINEYVQSTERTLNFQMDESSGKTVIRVYDTMSEKLIRQIPNELALELAQKLNDEEPSLLFSAQV